LLKSVNIWQSYKTERDCLMHFLHLLAVRWLGVQSARFKVHSFTHRLSNKPFLIRLLKTSPQLKYTAALPCNLSIMACFGDINLSQGSAATYARCGGTFNTHLTANLPRYLPVIFLNRSRFDRIMVTSLQVAPFFGPPCISSLRLRFSPRADHARVKNALL